MSAILPVFGVGNTGKSVNVTAQRRVNLYTEPSDDKSQLAHYSRPGLSPLLFPTTTNTYGGPVRGLIRVERVFSFGAMAKLVTEQIWGAQGASVVLSDDSPNTIQSAGIFQTFRTTDGPVVYADSGYQTMAVDGVSAYSASYASGSNVQYDLQTTGVANLPYGATSVCCLAGRFVVNNPFVAGRFNWSALLDATTWDALDYATAESIPDSLAAVYSYRGQLLLFGTRSIEFWAPTGDADVFAIVGGSGINWGLYRHGTIQVVDDALFFLGRSSGSEFRVCALNGYQVRVVSTPEVEYDINAAIKQGVVVSALVVRATGHTWYVVNLADTSWAFDATTGVWSEWQTEGKRFAGQYAVTVYGRTTITDYRDGRIYGFDPDAYVDGTASVVREITSKHLYNNLDRITVDQVVLDAEMGPGLSAGQGSDPKVMMQVSNDGGHTFGDEMWRSLGAMGKYAARAVWNRIGRARDFVFRWRISDPVKVVIMNVSARIRP